MGWVRREREPTVGATCTPRVSGAPYCWPLSETRKAETDPAIGGAVQSTELVRVGLRVLV